MNPHDVAEDARRLYQSDLLFWEKRAPELAEQRRKYRGTSGGMLRVALIKSLLIAMRLIARRPPRYVFENLRHLHLIQALPKSEVMILGGREEFISCLRMGYRFHWIGYISKAFNLFFWHGKEQVYLDSVRLLQRLFAQETPKRQYLFLWEDTLPTGLTLALALSSIDGLSIVCVQHGLYSSRVAGRLNEGSKCRFNLLIDATQEKFIEHTGDSRFYILGPPYDIRASRSIARKVVLVGQGWRGSDASKYLLMLYCYTRLQATLVAAGFDVIYRPHPTELADLAFVRSLFSNISMQDKLELLGSGKLIYVGVTSTLLYEARVAGNFVVGLTETGFPGSREFVVDYVLDLENLDDAGNLFQSFLNRSLAEEDPSIMEPLASRFARCLEQIDRETTLNIRTSELSVNSM